MNHDALAERKIADSVVRLLAMLLVLVALPHAANLSVWLLGFFLVMVAWRLAAIPMPRLMPGRWLLFLLMLSGIANVVLNTNIFDGRLLGTALLVVMLGLKLLELKSRRDMYVCVYLGFFLVTTQFLFHQDLWLAVYLFILAGLLGTLLVMLNRVHQDVRRILSATTVMVIGAVPMTLALFLLFPRLETPLWAIQIDNASGVTGISDHMEMGSVGQLSRSTAIAFHARFSGQAPPARERYWRGLVLWHYDGRTWTPEPSIRRASDLLAEADSRVDYEITLEPSNQPWVFALDMPSEVPQRVLLNEDYRLVSRDPITGRSTFKLTSYTRFRANRLTRQQRQMGLELPTRVSNRTRDLVGGWLDRHGSNNPRAIVEEALAYFNQQPFVYTLTPGVLAGDPVDSFLFETRRGFCEHFAASFTVLMRLAGIPTRIVLGYQGGELNPRAGHWVIRQSDAHAWNEVWLQGEGWVRIDPTAAVAPERIERSIDATQSAKGDAVVFRVRDGGLLADLWQEAGWILDAIDIGWHRWVLGFTHDRQVSLLKNLGLGELEGFEQGLVLVAAVGMGAMFAYVISVLRQRPHPDETLRLWQQLQARLVRKGLNLPGWFGPMQSLEAAARRWPDQREAFEAIVRLYIHLRYGRVSDPRQRRQLRRRIRALKLQ